MNQLRSSSSEIRVSRALHPTESVLWLRSNQRLYFNLIAGESTMKPYDDALSTMDFSVVWDDNGIRHSDCQHAHRVNFWRDILPPHLYQTMVREPGIKTAELKFQPGDALPLRSEAIVHQVPFDRVERRVVSGMTLEPRLGRFYPRGILRGISGVYSENVQPFRCAGLASNRLEADFNHPLAGKTIGIRVDIHELRAKFEERGGTAVDWMEAALTGPGMQVRVNGRPTDFFADQPFARQDEREDAVFYDKPRLVNHIDTQAIEIISRLYGRLIRPGSDVLDLMASWTSHLPADLQFDSLTVLGMNPDELEANARATERRLHDLNRRPILPFADARFDAVICTVSVEYLTGPFDVFAEVARTLKPDGVFVVAFSNRWFPPKVIRIWQELHEFERMGLVLEYFLKSGKYTKLETYSMRGLPRPANDKYASQLAYSDPVYAVWGRKR